MLNLKVRTAIHIVFDVLVVVLSVFIAYLLRFDFNIQAQFVSSIPYVIVSQTVITVCLLIYLKTYKKLWKYARIEDFISISNAVGLSVIIFFAFHHFIIRYFYWHLTVPRSVYILTGLTMFFGIVGGRLLLKMSRGHQPRLNSHKKALIVGAGEAGIIVATELMKSYSEHYPIAFVDDDENKIGMEFMTIPVMGNRSAIPELVSKHGVNDIILAIPSASRNEIADILKICRSTGCNIKIIPRVNDLINGKISINMIKNVSVEDLLGRDPIDIHVEEVSSYLRDKVVMITGAGGSIGSELCRQVLRFSPRKLILLGHGENSIYEIELELKKTYPNLSIEPVIADVQDINRIKLIFKQYRPEVVFHAAAHKHVPLMEKNPIEAIKNNVFGTKNVAVCSHEFGVDRFVMISTDKAVNPTNVMGATKRVAEMIVQGLDNISKTRFTAVRFGNVLGSRGSVIPIFKKQIEAGGPVTVTHPDMTRYFMTIPEAVQLVIQTGALANGGEIFILDMGKPVKIYDLAVDLIRLSGFEPNKDIDIQFTGIRPGEKLFEEILTSEEGTTATKHDRIFVGKPSAISYEDIIYALKPLEQLVQNEHGFTALEVKMRLKQLVSSFHWDTEMNDNQNLKEALQASLEVLASVEHRKG
jgi:FlaA1/EpsC-like NDP-sugar epimerase